MLITCPHCATGYQVDPISLGPDGRTVRCARCRTEWFAAVDELQDERAFASAGPDIAEDDIAAFRQELGDAAGDDRTAAADIQAVPNDDLLPGAGGMMESGTTEQELILPATQAPPLAPDVAIDIEHDEDIESAAQRRVVRRARKRIPRGPLPAIAAGLAIVIASLLIGRETVVVQAPQMASLYAAIGLPVNLRGLAFEDMAVSRGSHDGVPLLAVEGHIVNIRAAAIDVPRLRFAVLDRSGAEIYHWTAQPPKATLEPGETLPFRNRLASPPEGTQTIQVRFFHRRDALAAAP